MMWVFFAMAIGLISITIAVSLYNYIVKQDRGTERMQFIADAIKEGAEAYLRRQNRTLFIFVAVMAVILGLVYSTLLRSVVYGLSISMAYVLGSICTTLAAYFGMKAAVEANVRTANAARGGMVKAFPIAFYGGAVMGLFVVGLSLVGISVLFYVYRFIFGWGDVESSTIVLGFSFGASSLALFAKAGGGIYTKTADISADLVGKVELGIPEDDPRNPAVIADNVGDNVGDVAGMGADLIDSYIASIVAAMIIGAELGEGILLMLPLMVASIGLFSSIIGVLVVRFSIKGNPGAALNRGSFSTWICFAILLLVTTYFSGLGQRWLGVFLPTAAGLIAGVIIGLTSDYFTSIDRPPAKKVAEASTTGAAINILTGFSYGLISIVPPVIGICVATVAAWYLSLYFNVNPFYGIAISAVGMLATVGMTISADAYGPVSDNSKGIAEQSGLGEEIIDILDKLDAAGNTTKAITKGFAIGAAALTVLALFSAYAHSVDIGVLNLMTPEVISGLILGGMMPPLLSALLILAVGRNSERMIEEIRRQFKENPGILEGKAKPDYARCVDIATRGALKELIPICSLAIIVPILTLIFLGKEALASFLAGSIVTGIIFALFMANSGGLWDNAKKYIESGAYGGKGSEAHKAAVTGDTVGDPFKDTAGPSLNTMITVMSLVAEVFAPLIILLIP
ncbi:MAG: sodium-translocating pyrophosphatase [archaeon YNP-LCB-003-016]|jgi:K(+)-stimulated pyrophosphate-energized sodium pump|uniref:sodium-translocating pyrophosphatase n=1 Tax=Candidatus Culexarchaeum yellowstonense TaxID=2928963 RepID=UPI0026EF5761|nr:sodium-translocating pyrophosphatase [Candidatus Culexarchaeum yellowstonense]MCR6691236.1 sodium-translocating pyrophosphatase [Candidatus Culexarchaeum yellowstonense]